MTTTVTTDTNLRAFTLRDVPWGQLGTKIEPGTVVTAEQAAHLGGLDFEVELRNAGFEYDDRRHWRRVNRKAVVRKDTGEFFQFVSGGSYAPVQYAEAFSFMDGISPHYVAAGTLFGGKQGFLVVQLSNDDNSALQLTLRGQEDPHDVYVVLRTSHDMTRALEVNVLNLRGRCMNALALSTFNRNAVQRWSVRHTGDPMAKLREAENVLHRTIDYEHEFRAIAERLTDIDIDAEQSRDLLQVALPARPTRERKIEQIIAGTESETNGFGGTGWGLVNAVSEYFDWGRPGSNPAPGRPGLRTAESRFTSAFTGPTFKFTNRTAQLLLTR